MGKQQSYLQIFLSTRKITKFGKEVTSRKICSDEDSKVYFHHVENRNTIQDLIFCSQNLVLLEILSTLKLYTCLKNKIYLLLQFIEKIVTFFFIVEFDISTCTKML